MLFQNLHRSKIIYQHFTLQSDAQCLSWIVILYFLFRYTTSLGPDKVLRSSIVLLLLRWPRILMNGWTRGTTLTAMYSIVCNVLVVYVGECTLGGGLLGQSAEFSLMFERGCEALTAPIVFCRSQPSEQPKSWEFFKNELSFRSRGNSIS